MNSVDQFESLTVILYQKLSALEHTNSTLLNVLWKYFKMCLKFIKNLKDFEFPSEPVSRSAWGG